MKKMKSFFLLIACLFSVTLGSTLTSCGDNNGNSESNNFEDIKVDEIVEGNYGGWLEDIVVLNHFLGDNSRYGFTYNAPNNDINLKIYSSNDKVFTVEKDASANSYVIVTHKPGNAVLTIYDSTDYLYFRKIVRVRTAYTADTIMEAAYNNDIYTGFTGFGGQYRLNCITSAPTAQWQLTGKDEVEFNGMDIVFDCTYEEFYQPWDMFVFSSTITKEHDGNQTDIIYLYISRTADLVNLYYDIGGGEGALLNIFSPTIYSDIRPGF